jgi:TonB family protein
MRTAPVWQKLRPDRDLLGMGRIWGHTYSALAQRSSTRNHNFEDAPVPMYQNEFQPEDRLERVTPVPVLPASQDADVQRKRMLIALGILLLALGAVVLKDWDFWFPQGSEVQEAMFHSRSGSKTAAPVTASAPATPARERKSTKSPAPAAAEVPFAAATERAALPPLQVEVVAGNRHINVPAKSNAIHLDVNSGATSAASGVPAPANPVVSVGNRVQMSPQTAQSVSVSVPPDYPLLARQMKVQGAVSLQALISREGTIQELQILSGPSILAAAALEAVKQWHFKPFLQNGQPVETQARITVNFTISTN